jgi:uncharacterized protein YcbK (DUF882 family)
MAELPTTEVKARMRDEKKAQKQADAARVYYEMGVTAAWRGECVDNMPAFKRADRSSQWLRGFAEGQQAQREHRERGSINKAGLKKMVDIMRDTLRSIPHG